MTGQGEAKEETCVALRRPRLALDERCPERHRSGDARTDTLKTRRARGDGLRCGERRVTKALWSSRLAVGDAVV